MAVTLKSESPVFVKPRRAVTFSPIGISGEIKRSEYFEETGKTKATTDYCDIWRANNAGR
jgi:hypothetical protein